MKAEELRARWRGHTPGLLDAAHSYAVLCPVTEMGDGLSLLFEVRAATLRRQPGEVCFPGGAVEPGETPEACALRETREELSIPPEQIELLGRGDFICSPAGFILQPVLGLVSEAGLRALTPSPAEVAGVFSVPLRFFQQTPPELYSYPLRPRSPEGFPYEAAGIPRDYAWARGTVPVPLWRWQGHVIWGMTARIVRSIAEGTP